MTTVQTLNVINLKDSKIFKVPMPDLIQALESSPISEEDMRSIQKIIGLKLKNKLQNKFHKGERVQFKNKSGMLVQGTIKRVNKKTASLINCSDGKKWRVHFGGLTKAASAASMPPQAAQ